MLILLFASFLQTAATVGPEAVSGSWMTNRSANPADPYLKPMNLHLNEDGTVGGDFYEDEIDAGRWYSSDGQLCMSFRTQEDVLGPYHTAACLVGDKIEGQTWAERRNLLFVWTAERQR